MELEMLVVDEAASCYSLAESLDMMIDKRTVPIDESPSSAI